MTTPCTAHYAPSVASDVRVAPSVESDVRIAQRSILNRLVLRAARQSLFLINLDCFFARERYCCDVRVSCSRTFMRVRSRRAAMVEDLEVLRLPRLKKWLEDVVACKTFDNTSLKSFPVIFLCTKS